jgi:hypothetical protein
MLGGSQWAEMGMFGYKVVHVIINKKMSLSISVYKLVLKGTKGRVQTKLVYQEPERN